MTPAEQALLDAYHYRRDAEAAYRRALRKAKDSGMSNVKIAAIVGVTETAIRMYMKRHPR